MGQYSSRNLTEFEFHNARAEKIRWEGNTLICRVKQCNLHASAPENPYPQDMELKDKGPAWQVNFRSGS